MKKENIHFLLLIVSLLLSAGFIKKANSIKNKAGHISAARKKKNFVSHEVEFTFTGNTALYGTPKDCGIFKPDTVVLKGLLSGEENVERYDNIIYTGVLHLSIKMAVCNVKRVNGEDRFCTMSVNGNGPVKTELELDTAAGYGYIKINHDASLGAFTKKVNGTCDPKEMIDEENNVPNNTIAAIFNGYELRSLKNTPKLRPGKYIESGPNGQTVLLIK